MYLCVYIYINIPTKCMYLYMLYIFSALWSFYIQNGAEDRRGKITGWKCACMRWLNVNKHCVYLGVCAVSTQSTYLLPWCSRDIVYTRFGFAYAFIYVYVLYESVCACVYVRCAWCVLSTRPSQLYTASRCGLYILSMYKVGLGNKICISIKCSILQV